MIEKAYATTRLTETPAGEKCRAPELPYLPILNSKSRMKSRYLRSVVR